MILIRRGAPSPFCTCANNSIVTAVVVVGINIRELGICRVKCVHWNWRKNTITLTSTGKLRHHFQLVSFDKVLVSIKYITLINIFIYVYSAIGIK